MEPQTDERPADDEPELASRRELLIRIAGGAVGLGAATALSSCGSSRAVPRDVVSTSTMTARSTAAHPAATPPQLAAHRSDTISAGVQLLRSRSDLRPPEIIIDHPAGSVEPGVVLTDAHAGVTQQGPLILDQHGRMLWFKPVSQHPTPASRAFNLRVQRYRGEPVLTWFQGAVVSAHGEGHYEIYDRSYRQVTQVHAKHGYRGDLHEFVMTDSGSALFTCYGRATGTLPTGRRGAYWYGVVQEVDVATGKLLFQWRSDKHVPLAASYMRVPTNPADTWDYFHINAIGIDPSDGNLLISSRNTWACYKVHRTSGRVLWKLGGKDGDFKMGRDTHFAFQHDVQLQPGGVLTMFDNEGGPPNEASQSRGLVLSIDERRRRVRLKRQYHHHPPVRSDALGSLQLLGAGHAFMGWGDSSYFTEYDARGKVQFDGRLTRKTVSYRAFKQSWVGLPDGAPALAATRSGTTATLYASWNGATEIARWSVLGAADQGALTPLGIAEWLDFETAITVPNAPAYVRVDAVDGSGGMLGSSATVRV